VAIRYLFAGLYYLFLLTFAMTK